MRQHLPLVLVVLVLAAAPVVANEDPAAPEPGPAIDTAPVPVPAAGSVAPGDAAALKAVFEASADDAMMGMAMEDHAKHLLALADQWGDAPYAEVLATCSPEAITSTQGLLDYAGASRSKYRKTFGLKP